uniref:2Fe-2S iron-sulfur cluster-binding protein n=1 Tax=Neptunomonas phycophila TaxID=1572645 RepID=UPI0023F851C6
MTQKNRIPSGGLINRAKPVTFTYNGKSYPGFEGDTIASALLANGVDIVGRSFKYSRPRGLIAAGAEEPNGILQVGASEATQVPNVRATQQMLFDGLVCESTNGWPNANFDLMGAIGKVGGKMMPPGFYYKTFMFPQSMWSTYEKVIRKAAGFGRSPLETDPDSYDHINQHCDVMIAGAGPAGLAAALFSANSGLRVIIADEQSELGGSLLSSKEQINGKPALDWVRDIAANLSAHPNVTVLTHATVNGYHDHNFLTIHQRLTDHISDKAPNGQVRQRMHKVRAHQVILATGAHERPLVYGNNDLPGSMIASAVSTYINRFGVVPGESLVLMTTNDYAYQAAIDWHESGREVVAIVDTRANPEGDRISRAKSLGIKVITGSAVIDTQGKKRVTGVSVAPINAIGDSVTGKPAQLSCDTVASSGGWSPVIHL